MAAVTVIAGVLSSPAQRAAAQRPTVAVLGVASEEGDDELAAAITQALREELETDPGVRVSASRASLSQMTMLQDCDIVEADCRMRVGKAVNADQVIYGGLRRAGGQGGHEVELHRFTTHDGRDTVARRALGADETGDAQLAAFARALLAALRGERHPEPAASAAPADDGPPPVATVTPDVQPLDESELADHEPAPAAEPGSNDWLGYTLLGVAAVSAGLTVFSWTQIESAQNDDDFVAYGHAVWRDAPELEDICEEADRNELHGLDAQTVAGARSACDRGQTFDLLQYVFIGATLVSAGVGTYFLLDDEGGGVPSSGELSVRTSLGRDHGLLTVRLDL